MCVRPDLLLKSDVGSFHWRLGKKRKHYAHAKHFLWGTIPFSNTFNSTHEINAAYYAFRQCPWWNYCDCSLYLIASLKFSRIFVWARWNTCSFWLRCIHARQFWLWEGTVVGFYRWNANLIIDTVLVFSVVKYGSRIVSLLVMGILKSMEYVSSIRVSYGFVKLDSFESLGNLSGPAEF